MIPETTHDEKKAVMAKATELLVDGLSHEEIFQLASAFDEGYQDLETAVTMLAAKYFPRRFYTPQDE